MIDYLKISILSDEMICQFQWTDKILRSIELMEKVAEDENVTNGECERNEGGHDNDPEFLLLRVFVFYARIFVEEVVLKHELDSVFE